MTTTPRVRLFSGLALKESLETSILPAFRERHQVDIDATYEPTTVLVDLIGAGARPDVVVGVRGALRQLALTGLIEASSITPIVRSGLGVAVAAGTPWPAIDTVDAFRSSILGARAVAYSRSGASGIYFADLLDRWGIREEVDARATILDKGFTAEALTDGRADLAVQQLSELATVAGIDIVGPFPPEVQSYVELDAGARVGAAPAATALIAHLVAPEAVAAFGRARMEPGS